MDRRHSQVSKWCPVGWRIAAIFPFWSPNLFPILSETPQKESKKNPEAGPLAVILREYSDSRWRQMHPMKEPHPQETLSRALGHGKYPQLPLFYLPQQFNPFLFKISQHRRSPFAPRQNQYFTGQNSNSSVSLFVCNAVLWEPGAF